MIYLNQKYIDLTQTKGDFAYIVEDYNKKVNALKNKFGKFLTIKSRKEPKVNKTGLLEQVPNETIPLRITVGGKSGSEEWLYCESTPTIKDGQVIVDKNALVVQYGELTVDLTTQPDLAYFLTEKHSFLKKDETGKKAKYYVYDEENDNRSLAEQRSRDANLNNLIYGENSKLNVDIDFLRLIAKRWGIGNADKLNKFSLQNQLYDIVTKSDKKKGRNIEEFAKDVKSDDNAEQIEVSAKVRDAIDQKIIVFDIINKKWQIDYQDGNMKNIMTVSVEDLPRKDEVLILYMQNDTHLYAQLLAAMGADKEAIASSIDENDVLNCEDRFELTGWAKSLGLKIFQKKNEDLKQDILNKLREKK